MRVKSGVNPSGVGSAPEIPIAPGEPPKTGPLHTWVDGDGRGVWHYCGVCKVIRYPNGKLDLAICPGAHALKINPKYVRSDKSASAKSKPAARVPRSPKTG
jgi:hypothetical protein